MALKNKKSVTIVASHLTLRIGRRLKRKEHFLQTLDTTGCFSVLEVTSLQMKLILRLGKWEMIYKIVCDNTCAS